AELFADLQHAYNEIQEVDTLKSNFLSTISHELRTPLTSILGFVQLILEGRADGPINETQRRLLMRVVDKSRDLHSMVNDILEIAEIQAEGLVRLDPEPVAVEEIVGQVIDRVAQRRRTAEVEIEHRLPAQPLPLVMGDFQAVERVFYHIIDNALKFIPVRGKVAVSYRSLPGHVEVSVQDTGIGMAPEHLGKIFDHFYQIENDLSRAYNGVGLGLTITKKLLTLLDAPIHVESELGKGTTMTVSFKVADVEEPAP
ncbi:HAMP domain-containing histidine kinase, partial [Candidatus Sumerlaeota bacterium]|nr:HAMP domain-containing histidine kinase [Candidatus Sumerlaeota bacterium]